MIILYIIEIVSNKLYNKRKSLASLDIGVENMFKFIDLFAGIGGIRMAYENLGGECVFSSEIDKFAQETYAANYGEKPLGDITKINEKDIPEHDVLLAGFPCQAFSIAGKKAGFDDIRGTMFFEVARIIKHHRPKAIFLENVKGLRMHNKGKTLKTILDILRDDLGYYVPEPQIVNAKDYGLAQNRERIIIVCFRKDVIDGGFMYPEPSNKRATIKEIIEKNPVSVKYYLSSCYLETLRRHRRRHESRGNGFGYEIKSHDDIANAIVVGGMGKERNLIIDKRLTNFVPVTKIKGEVNREYIRKMTPREWARLQGFPDSFKIVVSDAQAYKQFGNSVAVPAISAVAECVVNIIEFDNVGIASSQ
jgi:DNA (cytosine-5)-methyltransferase 1